MSTIKAINVIHPSSTTNNIVTDDSGNVAVGGALTVGGVAAVAVAPGTSGNVLTSDGTNWTSGTAPVINVQTFDASGTWTKPSGYAAGSRVYIQAWGAGGSGRRESSTTTIARGGGGGAYSSGWRALSDLGATETITIGAGGAARTGTNQDGASGGNTLAGNFLSAGGGGGGITLSPNSIRGDLVDGVPSLENGGNGSTNNNPGESRQIAGAGGGGLSSTNTFNDAGISRLGGDGGAGSLTTAGDGSVPGGGGGGARTTSGAGGDGRVIITVFPA
jgi:hypothetical protein